MTSREEFHKYRSTAHKQEINIHGGTYSDVPNRLRLKWTGHARKTTEYREVAILVFSINEKGSYLCGICVTGTNIFPLMGKVSTHKKKSEQTITTNNIITRITVNIMIVKSSLTLLHSIGFLMFFFLLFPFLTF